MGALLGRGKILLEALLLYPSSLKKQFVVRSTIAREGTKGRRNHSVVNSEVTFSDFEELVSTTDTRGIITYANDVFCKVAGFKEDELVGKNHNIVHHPDIPKAAFADMWERLKEGKAWRGAVKNRCKDGRYYWLDAFVNPIYEKGNKVVNQSVRRKLRPENRQRDESLNANVNAGNTGLALLQRHDCIKGLSQWQSQRRYSGISGIHSIR